MYHLQAQEILYLDSQPLVYLHVLHLRTFGQQFISEILLSDTIFYGIISFGFLIYSFYAF